jgi:hypothetical protein
MQRLFGGTMKFNVGDILRIKPENMGASPLLAEYLKDDLTVKYVNGDYVVLQEIYSKHGSHKFYRWRFELARGVSPHSAIITKIRQMDSRRKDLGYAF